MSESFDDDAFCYSGQIGTVATLPEESSLSKAVDLKLLTFQL